MAGSAAVRELSANGMPATPNPADFRNARRCIEFLSRKGLLRFGLGSFEGLQFAAQAQVLLAQLSEILALLDEALELRFIAAQPGQLLVFGLKALQLLVGLTELSNLLFGLELRLI